MWEGINGEEDVKTAVLETKIRDGENATMEREASQETNKKNFFLSIYTEFHYLPPIKMEM